MVLGTHFVWLQLASGPDLFHCRHRSPGGDIQARMRRVLEVIVAETGGHQGEGFAKMVDEEMLR